jgi:hypothetical protein
LTLSVEMVDWFVSFSEIFAEPGLFVDVGVKKLIEPRKLRRVMLVKI